jgi:hypothetical protein
MSRIALLRWRSHLAAICTFALLAALMAFIGVSPANAATEVTFSGSELLGTPTDTSIAVNVVPDANINLYYEYGTSPAVYTGTTGTALAVGGEPFEAVLTGLSPDTRYYYRLRYQVPGQDDWTARDEHTFHTARAEGEEFSFTVTSDSHLGMMGSASRYEQATLNVAADQPDFHFDLGDTFITNSAVNQAGIDQAYMNQRPYIGNYASSSPVFLTPGNHENEEGWNLDDAFSKALASINSRKAFYPTPSPATLGDFYTTDTTVRSGVDGNGYPEGYYAFEWGDALFVVVNPFHYTMTNPYGATAGEDADEVVSGDQWVWTLGSQQYQWLKTTLQNSNADFKFVFSHHLTGGQLETGGSAGAPEYVRGGANAADYWEWGGKDQTGSYTFDTERPGWGEPIHELFVDNGVTAYFHGHDHQYAYEVADGVVYQSVPSPSMTGSGFSLYSESDPETIKVLPNSGHIRVTVSPTTGLATVDYVRSDDVVPGTNGDVSYTYTMGANDGPTSPYVYRVNAGGETLSGISGPDYVGISGNGTSGGVTVSGASSNSTTTAMDLSGVSLDLSDSDAQALFKTTLYAASATAMSFAFDLDNGNYDVLLHLVEQQASFGVGDRVFDVAFEGTVVLDDFDVFAEVGASLVGYTETVPVTVSDGELNIDFTNVTSYANIKGIEILAVAGPDETPPVITLSGATEMWIEVGDDFVDPGATAFDGVDGSVPVIVGGDTVNTDAIGDYAITYDASDAAGNAAVRKTRTVHVIADTGIIYRVNAGGSTLSSTYGPSFVGVAGDGASGGITVSGTTANSTTEAVDLGGVSVDLSSADAEDLFQTTLYSTGTMSWAFDVDNGIYEVKLHLIEQQADFTAGERVVDVSLEGAVRLNDLDVYVEAGGPMKAYTESVLVAVGDGELNIDFTGVVSYPNIRGIEIIESSDDVAPVITLIGANPLTHEAGGSFTDPGARVNDNLDATTTITGVSTVDADTPGNYTITYDYTDDAGNAAATVVRNVHVVDTTAPVITLLGRNPMFVLQGSTFIDPGATASDTLDGNLTAQIVVGGDAVNTGINGNYVMRYNVSDAAGNDAAEVTRTVTVTEDLPPELTLLGDKQMIIEAGSDYVEPGATATDYEDGDLTGSIVIDATSVDTSAVGDYSVAYSVEDSFGNITTETRSVQVVDTTPPVITLLGSNPMTLELGDAFTDPKATVTDNADPTTTISGVSTVVASVAGVYTVTYDYTDAAGNTADRVIRTVTVADTTPPPSFSDDDSVFEADIEWLAAKGITRGCNPPVNDMFCPNDPTTRGQMAAFFHRALNDVIDIDIDSVIVFSDARTSVFASDIEWLSAAGITKGCNPPANDMYCPAGSVSRGQMAAFIRRAFEDLIPTPAPSGLVFTDTVGSVFASDIQWLADTGITKGCGTDTFCPDELVTRGQMAAFFRRAFMAVGLE